MNGTLRIVVDGRTTIDVGGVDRDEAEKIILQLSRKRGVAVIEHPGGAVSAIKRRRFIAAEYEPKTE